MIKFHWGWAIVFAFVLFASGVFYVIWRSSQSSVEMVTPNYYEKEIEFQGVIDQKKNYQSLQGKLVIERAETGLIFHFPSDFKGRPIQGKIHFYRPSNLRMDRHFELDVDENLQMFIAYENLFAGKYLVKLHWVANDLDYYYEEPWFF